MVKKLDFGKETLEKVENKLYLHWNIYIISGINP